MPLKRTTHWAAREFHQFLLARAATPFAWGANDCCLFAADAIESFTGVDLAEDFRGKYHDEASAMALIRQLAGTATVEGAVLYCAQTHDLAEWSAPLFAQRGDLVLVEDAGRLVSGVVHLNGRHVAVVGESGLKRLPIRGVKRAWKI
ncbi:MAG: hypothetical protein WAM66_07585 [Acidobacteriaceae bacterium]